MQKYTFCVDSDCIWKNKKVMGEDPRRISAIHLEITFIQPVSEKHRTILERAAHHCPVSKSLHPDLKEVVTFHYSEE